MTPSISNGLTTSQAIETIELRGPILTDASQLQPSVGRNSLWSRPMLWMPRASFTTAVWNTNHTWLMTDMAPQDMRAKKWQLNMKMPWRIQRVVFSFHHLHSTAALAFVRKSMPPLSK